ncbi:MAG: mechanosensitive ion channel family protein [Bacteroidales bacterium]|jgi:small-conductance mechanosensitive channel|nr:mechanosensitive ion channel family protein [Bacteroidales bacterium]
MEAFVVTDFLKVYVPQIVITILSLMLLSFSKYVIRKLIKKSAPLLQKPDKQMGSVKRLVYILLNVAFIFVVAIVWGVSPQNLLVGLSSVFAIVGVALFAQWSLLSNITAGIVMFFSAPFRIGDHVHILDKDISIVATIEDFKTFYTHIRTEDEELIVLPNNLFLQKTVAIKKENKTKEN